MNIFKNKSGQTIFSIDDQGNVSMTGNLFVGGDIDKVLETAFEVVRTPEGMATPFEGAGEVICYLGETTGNYAHGSLWEKVPVGYFYEVDPTSNTDPAFSVAGQGSGTVIPSQLENDVIYPYLQLFPNTTKVVIEAADKGLASRVWDIHFYDKNDNLLYTEETNQSLFENISDTIYFAPTYTGDLTVDFTVEMAVTPQCELVPLDGASYVPVTGGEFTGTLVVRDILPKANNNYSLGSSARKYHKGWFIDVEADGIIATNVDAQDIQINSNHQVEAGDSVAVVESTSGHYAARRGPVFDGQTRTKFLSKAGTWELAPSSGGGGGIPTVIGNVGITEAGEVIVTGIDNIIAPNTYNIVDGETGNVVGILEVWFDGQEYVQNVYPRYNTFDIPISFVSSLPTQIRRHGESGYWSSWWYKYNTGEINVFRHPGDSINSNPESWYTLSHLDWKYLLNERTNAASLYGLGTVGDVKGLIILNDNGDVPVGGHFTPTVADFSTNVYSKAEWDKLYDSRMIFLPSAGIRDGASYNDAVEAYWTSTYDSDSHLYLALEFEANTVSWNNDFYPYYGLAVRLFHKSSSGKFSVADGKVTPAPGNLQYHPRNKVWRFAKNQYDIIGSYNGNIDDNYNGWIDLFGYGTYNNPTIHSNSWDPQYSILEVPAFDWGTNTIYEVSKINRIDCMGEDY